MFAPSAVLGQFTALTLSGRVVIFKWFCESFLFSCRVVCLVNVPSLSKIELGPSLKRLRCLSPGEDMQTRSAKRSASSHGITVVL